MPYFAIDEPGFWSIGPESLEWMRVMADALDVQFARFPLGDPEDEATPFASVLRMPPNFELWRHKHDCYRFEAIVEGTLTVDGTVRGPGTIMTSAPGEAYGPYFVGPNGCVTIEIFSARRGVPVLMDDETDPRSVDFLRTLLADEDPERRAAAQIALGDFEEGSVG